MSIRIRKVDLMNAVFVILLLKFDSFKYLIPTIDVIYDICFIIIGLLISFYYIVNINKYKDLFALLVTIFCFGNIVVTIINDGAVYNAIASQYKLLVTYIYVRVFWIEKKIDFKIIYNIFMFFLCLNILFYFLFPNGMYTMIGSNGNFYSTDVWLLGGKNAYFYYLSMTTVMYWLIYEKNFNVVNKKSFVNIFFYIVIIMNLFISKSATTIMGMIILITMLIFIKHSFFKRKLVIYLFSFGCILLFGLVMNIENFELFDFVFNWLGKEKSFTGRTSIWIRSIEAIKDNFLFGYGFEETTDIIRKIGQTTSHNKYLWIVYRGGLFSFSIFAVMLFLTLKNIKDFFYMISSKIMFCFVITLFIVWQVEVYDNNTLIFALIVYCNYIGITKSRVVFR